MTFDMPTVLMCPPPTLGTDGEDLSRTCDLHQWGERPRSFDLGRAAAQWDTLRTRLESLGVDVRTLPARDGLPDLMFTADTALIDGNTAIISHFKHRVRLGEAAVVAEWLTRAGYQVVDVPAEFDFEGNGQAIICGEAVFGGWFSHRERVALKWLGDRLDRPVVTLRLACDTFDRLDSCFRPLTDNVALYVPEAFDSVGRAALENRIEHLIPVPADEAVHLAATAVAIDKHVLMPSGSPRTSAAIQTAGFDVVTIDVDAFEPVGGTLAGLILRLDSAHCGADRSDAAVPQPRQVRHAAV